MRYNCIEAGYSSANFQRGGTIWMMDGKLAVFSVGKEPRSPPQLLIHPTFQLSVRYVRKV